MSRSHPVEWLFAVTTAGNSYIGIAGSKDDAADIFMNLPDVGIVLCVDVPRAAYCSCLHDAVVFFEQPNPVPAG